MYNRETSIFVTMKYSDIKHFIKSEQNFVLPHQIFISAEPSSYAIGYFFYSYTVILNVLLLILRTLDKCHFLW